MRLCSCKVPVNILMLWLVLSIAYLTTGATVWAAGGIQVYPQRVIFEGKNHVTTINLINPDTQAATYRIDMTDVIYTDDATVTTTNQPPAGYPSARSLIRFSPRQVRLAPNGNQTVRVLLRRDVAMPDGEYRIHAVFSRLPNVEDLAITDNNKTGVAKNPVGIDVSMAIPIMVRIGTTSAVGGIKSIITVPKQAVPTLDLQLWRTGNRSLLVDVVVTDAGDKEVQRLDGLALPVPNAQRRLLFQLPNLTPKQLKTRGYQLKLLDHDTHAVLDRKPVTF